MWNIFVFVLMQFFSYKMITFSSLLCKKPGCGSLPVNHILIQNHLKHLCYSLFAHEHKHTMCISTCGHLYKCIYLIYVCTNNMCFVDIYSLYVIFYKQTPPNYDHFTMKIPPLIVCRTLVSIHSLIHAFILCLYWKCGLYMWLWVLLDPAQFQWGMRLSYF